MKIPVLVGPTSSGKTSIALQVCEKNGAHVISADSRQVYKYMDIGTGKLPINTKDYKIERGEGFWKINDCTIWGYDLVEPSQNFNAYEFATFALAKIKELENKDIPVLIVGGTGFFVDTLTGRTKLNATEADPNLRAALNDKNLDELLVQLKDLSPQMYLSIDQKNKVRVIRAIERLLSVSAKSDTAFEIPVDFEFEYIGLTANRNVLYERADIWAQNIWGDLLFEEIKYLISNGFSDSNTLKGLIYKTGVEFLNNQISFELGLERIKFDIHAYIRRQQTWFKKNHSIKWQDIQSTANADIVSIVSNSLYN
jgi:tRNA dimethylallyltransferase